MTRAEKIAELKVLVAMWRDKATMAQRTCKAVERDCEALADRIRRDAEAASGRNAWVSRQLARLEELEQRYALEAKP